MHYILLYTLDDVHPRSLTARPVGNEDDPFLLGRQLFTGELLNYGGVVLVVSNFLMSHLEVAEKVYIML